MQRLKALDEVAPADLWREVPEAEDEFWSDARERQRRLLKVLLEGAREDDDAGARARPLSSADTRMAIGTASTPRSGNPDWDVA